MSSSSTVGQELLHLFDAAVRFTSESPADALIPPDGREGAYLGDGDGVVSGERLRGGLRFSFYSGNCLYPRIRRGEEVPDALNLCTLNPADTSSRRMARVSRSTERATVCEPPSGIA